MRLRTVLAAAAVALGLGLAVSSPASANPFHHFHHWGHGFGWGGFGMVDIGGSDEDSCIRWRPSFNRYGEYVGQRPVNVCD